MQVLSQLSYIPTVFVESEANYSKGRYPTQGGCRETLGLSPILAMAVYYVDTRDSVVAASRQRQEIVASQMNALWQALGAE